MFRCIYNGELEKKAIKEIFSEEMLELFAADENVVYLDADLMNSFGMIKPWKQNPNRVFNCGIMEANMMGVAAGMSAVGKKPYVHTFGPFASRRCFDQVFLSVAYAGNSVHIFGSDPGVCAAFNGGTHMPFEDMALMRAVPTAVVIDVSDSTMLRYLMKATKDRRGLTYMRTTRKNCAVVYEPGSTFELGKGNVLKDGGDLTIIASGIMVDVAMKAAKLLADEGIGARVVDMFCVKPIDADLIVKCAAETGAIVTAENHNIIGGLGSAVAEAVCEGKPVPVVRVGVNDEFGEVGTEAYLRERFKLTPQNIYEKAKIALANKTK